MKPIRQTIFEPPLGNCLQAAVASVLGLDLDDVPNFMERKGPGWYDDFVSFLLGYGMYPIYLDMDYVGSDGRIPLGYHLIQGKSPRGDHDHVIVAHEGVMIHDPHPSEAGLESEKYYIIFADNCPGCTVQKIIAQATKGGCE